MRPGCEKSSSEQMLEMCRRYKLGESLLSVGGLLGSNPISVGLYLLQMGMALHELPGRAR